ncbi:hypothetical protein GCM10007391_01080 [Alteromonas halophila]|uniref:Phage shock protein B n=2 Tax=Alteromonas halophila TaxID=516698 RepID=A0A918JBR4_9ALTE|nr:hypothetical protein GCM10007391_01080 [Alteromonas halophila]
MLTEGIIVNMTAIAIVAIIGWVIVTIVESRKDKNKGMAKKDRAALEAEIATLKDRVATLEKIVTDDGYDLKKQFADLEKDKVA